MAAVSSMTELCDKYGFNRLTRFREIAHSIPESMPESAAMEAITTALQLDITDVDSFIKDVQIAAPKLLTVSSVTTKVHFLCPPTTVCLLGCTYKAKNKTNNLRELVAHRDAVQVDVYELSERVGVGYEYTLRCTSCNSRFGYSSFYNAEKEGHFLYESQRELLFVTERVYWSREMAELLINNILHAHCSYQAFAEIIRETFNWPKKVTRKMTSAAFYNNEIENELRNRGVRFKFSTRKINCNEVKDFVESCRRKEIYAHDCGEHGKMRGCPYLDIMDGVWKFGHRHCAMDLETKVHVRFVKLPPVCQNEPMYGQRFCSDHIQTAKEMGLPLTKKALLDGKQQEMPSTTKTADELFDEDMKPIPTEQVSDAFPLISCRNKTAVAPWCTKSLGPRKKGCWSRGLFVFVSACGNISYFAPLYRSESMSQVFVLTMEWLFKRLQTLPVSEWERYFLCYDNMCNFCNLKAMDEPLGHIFPEPYAAMWTKIQKIIDELHLANHKRASCKVDYNPERFRLKHPEAEKANTMAAEQSFSWLTRYKKQIDSMSKRNQFFFIHRIILRRNEYNKQCLLTQKTPLQWSVRSEKARADL